MPSDDILAYYPEPDVQARNAELQGKFPMLYTMGKELAERIRALPEGELASRARKAEAARNPTVMPFAGPVPGDIPGAILANVNQGLSVGVADEGAAAISTLLGMDPDKGGALFGNYDGIPFITGDLYSRNLDAQRRLLSDARRDRPVTSTVSEAAGAIANPAAQLIAGMVAGRAGRPVMTVAERAARGIGAGAAVAAPYGFGAGEGGFESRLGNAAKSGVAGGIAGGLVPVMTAAGGGLARMTPSAQAKHWQAVNRIMKAVLPSQSGSKYADVLKQARKIVNRNGADFVLRQGDDVLPELFAMTGSKTAASRAADMGKAVVSAKMGNMPGAIWNAAQAARSAPPPMIEAPDRAVQELLTRIGLAGQAPGAARVLGTNAPQAAGPEPEVMDILELYRQPGEERRTQ